MTEPSGASHAAAGAPGPSREAAAASTIQRNFRAAAGRQEAAEAARAALALVAAPAPRAASGAAETAGEAVARLRRELGEPRHIVCVLGGTAFQDSASEALVQALARDLAADLGPEVAFVTGGMPGVQRAFAGQCGDGSRLWNLVPRAESSDYGVGRDVHAGADLAERKEVFGQLGDVYVTVEGGPGVAQESRAAAARGAAIVPLIRTGGASAGMFDFPPEALQRPAFATQEQWELLSSPDATVAMSAAAAAHMVTGIISERESRQRREPARSPARSPPASPSRAPSPPRALQRREPPRSPARPAASPASPSRAPSPPRAREPVRSPARSAASPGRAASPPRAARPIRAEAPASPPLGAAPAPRAPRARSQPQPDRRQAGAGASAHERGGSAGAAGIGPRGVARGTRSGPSSPRAGARRAASPGRLPASLSPLPREPPRSAQGARSPPGSPLSSPRRWPGSALASPRDQAQGAPSRLAARPSWRPAGDGGLSPAAAQDGGAAEEQKELHREARRRMKKSPDFAANVWAELHAMHGHRLEVLEEVRQRAFEMDHPVSFGTEEELAAACMRLHSNAAPAGARTEASAKEGRRREVNADAGACTEASAKEGKRREVNVDALLRRLHDNEELKERRRETEEKVINEVMKECTFRPQIIRKVEPGAATFHGSHAIASERLYLQGKERDQALSEKRERQLEKEARQLQESSVHNLAGKKKAKARTGNGNLVQKGNVYERSLTWKKGLDRRIAETRDREGAELAREMKLQESAVQRRLRLSGSTAATAQEKAVDRLYRVDLTRRKARANERMQDRQRDIERELQEQELKSVHAKAAARQWAPGELREIRQRLAASPRRAAAAATPLPRSPEAEKEDEARRELARELCAALGPARGGPSSEPRLGQRELRRLAELCGFHGGDAGWAAQYEQLADIYGFEALEGPGPEHLEALTGDDGGRLHCSEDELRFLLALLGSRAELTGQLFRALDTNSSGGIGSREMRRYAAVTGFNGDAEAWAAAFAALCSAYGWSEDAEVDPWRFAQMVNDEDGEGHLTDADLELVLARAQSRPLLVARLFRALDAAGTGRLAAEELGHLAAARGRGLGGAGELAPGGGERGAYEALAGAHGWDPDEGVGPRDFARMVNDAESPAHCTTRELRGALAALGWRPELIVSAFGALEEGGSGRLPGACLRRYAEFCGFEGSDAEWQQEYSDLAARHGWDELCGADLRGFASMVNDSSGNGHCSAEELLQFVRRGL
ncbi:unnamed protein product [Prorocentrum cordatum]|uniref:EF-hand domain-containing protein n=1 Tax=Prorocentrum cordatum TaxID=2364126 RepID=A0ABN9R7G8_9DINO|nr:unnamed protein product [Polarella glacialis]